MVRVTTRFNPFTTTPDIDNQTTYPEAIDVRNAEMQSRCEQIDSIGQEINAVADEVNQATLNTSGYRDTTKKYRDESLENKNLALTYKTGAELAYNNTATLLSTLVIPIEATYSYAGANAKFAYKTDSFLNFNIGE